ncbi:MAG: tail fiber protein [Verrucomicrobia bacterium]|nr:tail fiber protein [Verrucomicrobiota bacterium]
MDSYLGEIRPFAGTFAPVNWMLCNGQILPIRQYTPLFALIGTTYGGDGTATFALPNFQARAAMNQGQGPGLTQRYIGEPVGSATVGLTVPEMAAHPHAFNVQVTGNAASTSPQDAVPAAVTGRGVLPTPYVDANGKADMALNPSFTTPSGNGAPHNNQSPYLAVNFIISMAGEFPSFQ